MKLKKPTLTVENTYDVVDDLVIAPGRTRAGGSTIEVLKGSQVVSIKFTPSEGGPEELWLAEAGEFQEDRRRWFKVNPGQMDLCLRKTSSKKVLPPEPTPVEAEPTPEKKK